MICEKHKFIYIGVPKTGTTSIETYLKKNFKILNHCQKKHTPINLHSDNYISYFKFAFVRNPWEWVVSWFRYLKFSRKNFEYENFEKWLIDELNLKGSLKNFNDPLFPQYKFLCNKNDELIIDFIGRFERLQEDFNKICRRIKISNYKLDNLNSSTNFNYKDFYNCITKELVEKNFEKDIELFKYKY